MDTTMDGLNKCMLLGRLTADPELRFTQGGQAVLNIRMATNESYLDKDKVRQERVEYHAIVVWGKRGEGLAKILRKGDPLFVEGGLRTSTYDDRDGNKKYKVEIHATNVILCGGKGAPADDTADRGNAPPRDTRPSGGGRPAAPRGQAPARPAAQAAAADDYDSGGGYGGGGDDDIPF